MEGAPGYGSIGPPSGEQARKKLQRKLHRLDEAFPVERSIDIDTYDRHADRVREQMTLLKIDEHSSKLEELDVEGILAFAERVLPRTADLWRMYPAVGCNRASSSTNMPSSFAWSHLFRGSRNGNTRKRWPSSWSNCSSPKILKAEPHV